MSREREADRWKKRAEDRERELKKLRGALEEARRGSAEVQILVDGVLIATALQYGEEVRSEESGALLGRRLVLPGFRAEELRSGYELHARRDEKTGDYVLGVVERTK